MSEKKSISGVTDLSANHTIPAMRSANDPPANDPLSDLDMIGRELYARRLQELTLFGAMSEDDAHDWALRYALGKSSPAPTHDYPDDYSQMPAQ